MMYHVKNEQGNIIASFVNEYDRDLFLDVVSDEFDDCEFTKSDETSQGLVPKNFFKALGWRQ